MSGAPLWLIILQAFSIPFLAGVIGFMQWRTAHQKVALDLFERRMRIYESVRLVGRQVRASGGATIEHIAEMHSARAEARFLFGRSVEIKIKEMISAMIDLETAASQMQPLGVGDERSEAVARRWEAVRTCARLYEESPEWFLPFMRMHTRPIRTPTEFLRDAWIRSRRERD